MPHLFVKKQCEGLFPAFAPLLMKGKPGQPEEDGSSVAALAMATASAGTVIFSENFSGATPGTYLRRQ
jgi:hypothetical protein